MWTMWSLTLGLVSCMSRYQGQSYYSAPRAGKCLTNLALSLLSRHSLKLVLLKERLQRKFYFLTILPLCSLCVSINAISGLATTVQDVGRVWEGGPGLVWPRYRLCPAWGGGGVHQASSGKNIWNTNILQFITYLAYLCIKPETLQNIKTAI